MTPKKRLGEMLVEAGIVDPAGLSAALAHHRQWGMRLGQALVELKFATERDIVQALSRKLGIEVAVLSGLAGREFDAGVKLIPLELAQKNNLLPVGDDGTTLTVAMSDPVNVNVIDELAFRTGRKLKVTIGGDREIGEAVRRHYGVSNPRVESIALDDDPNDDGVMTLVGHEHGGPDDGAEWRTKETRLPRHNPMSARPEPDERTARHDLLGSVPAAGFDVEKTVEMPFAEDDLLEPLPLEPEPEQEREDARPPPPVLTRGAPDPAPTDPGTQATPAPAAVPDTAPGPRPAAPAPHPTVLTPAQRPAAVSAPPAPQGEDLGLPSAAAAAVAAIAARGSGDPILADAARVLSAVLRVLVRKGVVTDAEITAELRQYMPMPRPKR